MKYKTFRALAFSGCGVVGLGVCGGVGWAVMEASKPTPTPTPFVDTEKDLFTGLGTLAPTSTPAATPAVASGGNLRPMDQEILKAIPPNISAADGKVKDGIRGKPWKVNFYTADEKPGAVARLKIDLDRDDKWDEKWSKEGDGWKRQVSSKENEVYEDEYLLRDGSWVKAGSQVAATPAPMTSVTAAPMTSLGDESALRPLDQRILDKARQPIAGSDKIKDAFSSEKWKVNIYQDAGQSKPNRLKIDFDRDEKWDEKWTFDGDQVKRQVSPNDDDVYTIEYRLRGGAWVLKK